VLLHALDYLDSSRGLLRHLEICLWKKLHPPAQLVGFLASFILV